MKKYLLVSLTILFTAAFVWAAEATVAESKVDVDAEATLSWGIDLGKGDKIKAKHGFKNEASWTVKFPLINKGNMTSTKADVPVYGEVALENIALDIVSEKDTHNDNFRLNGKIDGINASLFFYGAYLSVFDSPDFKANYAQLWKPLENNKKYQASDYRYKPGFDGAGTKIGYANKDLMDLDVGLKLGSSSNWDPDEESFTQTIKYFDGNTKLGNSEYIFDGPAKKWLNGKDYKIAYDTVFPEAGYYPYYKKNDADETEYKYGIGFDFSIKPLDKMLGIGFTVNSTFGKEYPGADEHLSFGVEVTSEPIDALKLKFGFDGGTQYVKNAKFKWDTAFTAEYKWVSGGMYVSSPGTKYAGISGKDNKPITDLSLFVQFATKGDKKEASNLVEGLDAGVYVGMYKLLTFANKADGSKMQFPLVMKLWGAYKANLNDAMWVKPFANVWMETNHTVKNEPSLGVAYDVGVAYSPVEKVVVEAKWSHGATKKNSYADVVKTSMFGDGHHNGKFVLSLNVKY